MRSRILPFAILAASLPFLVAADECGDELPKESTDEAARPAVAIGEPASAGSDGWNITVVSVRKFSTISAPGGTKTALGTYVAVELHLENTSKERQALGGNRFKLADSAGRNYTWYEAGTEAYGKKELGSRINPGLAAPAVVVFDVPKEATGLVLRGVGGVRIALGDAAAIP